MTDAQNNLYFREWAKVRKLLIAEGMTPAEADAMRHTLHARALGACRSSKSFSNTDFDKVLAVFRARTRPGDPSAQIRQADQPRLRALHKLTALASEMRLQDEYIEGMAHKICRSSVATCDSTQLRKLLAALTAHQRRQRITPTAPPEDSSGDGDPF